MASSVRFRSSHSLWPNLDDLENTTSQDPPKNTHQRCLTLHLPTNPFNSFKTKARFDFLRIKSFLSVYTRTIQLLLPYRVLVLRRLKFNNDLLPRAFPGFVAPIGFHIHGDTTHRACPPFRFRF